MPSQHHHWHSHGVLTLAIFSFCIEISFYSLLCEAAGLQFGPILNLPGAPSEIPFEQESGYIVLEDIDLNVFYWMVSPWKDKNGDETFHVYSRKEIDQRKMQRDVELNEEQPVIFAFTGGPGCSSSFSLFHELGPWRISSDSATLALNPFAWNKAGPHGAYVVFVDQPGGVGFSTPYRATSDNKAADDVAKFLEKFASTHPELARHPWILWGESYSGVSVPLFAQRVVSKLPLRGIIIGNGIMSRAMNAQNYPVWLNGHSLISENFFKDLDNACAGNFSHPVGDECKTLLGSIGTRLGKTFNMYDMFASCPPSMSLRHMHRMAMIAIGNISVDGTDIDTARVDAMNFGSDSTIKGAGDNCVDSSRMHAYLNRGDVKSAIHADPSITWSMCREPFNLTRDYSSLVPEYMSLVGRVEMEIYSGDVDTVINTLGAREGVKAVAGGKDPSTAWSPWYVQRTGQVAGFIEAWADERIVFRTVKGASHMVPESKPEASLQLIDEFVKRCIQ